MPTANDEPPISLQDLREKVQSEHDRLEDLPAAGDVARAGSLLSAAWFLEQLDGLIESSPVLDTSFELGISGYDVEMEGSTFEVLVKTYRGDNRLLRVSREIVLPMPLREALPVLVAAGIVEEIEGGFRTTPPTTTRKRLMCRMTFSEMD